MENIKIIKNFNSEYPYRKNIDGYEVEFLDPNILVFKNAITNNKEIIDFHENVGQWGDWYVFGEMSKNSLGVFDFDTFPNKDQWIKEVIPSQSSDEGFIDISSKVTSVLYDISKIYMEQTGKTYDSTIRFNQGPLAKYYHDKEINKGDRSMNWHTDYQNEFAETEGYKFSVTMVAYPNDDYESGEISFKVYNEDESDFTSDPNIFIDYKPSEGDIVCFPSAHPYYHGVKRVYKSPKYIIRSYWMYYYSGSEYWHSLKEKYGESFQEMEKARIRRKDFLITNPVQQMILPMKTYYYLLENNLLPEDPIHEDDSYSYLEKYRNLGL